METITDLQKEALTKHNNIAFDDFNEWFKSLSRKDALEVMNHINIGLYKDNPITNKGIFDLIFKYLPSEVKFKNEDKTHYFSFSITKTLIGFSIGYYHYLIEGEKEIDSGMTDIWCNPFQNYRVCNNLIVYENIIPESDKSFIDAIRKIYEFLVNNDIIFVE